MLPVNYSEVGAVGVADSAPMDVPGITAEDIVLAIMAWDPTGGDPTGIDVSEATAGEGTVTLSTSDLTDQQVWVMWVTPGAS